MAAGISTIERRIDMILRAKLGATTRARAYVFGIALTVWTAFALGGATHAQPTSDAASTVDTKTQLLLFEEDANLAIEQNDRRIEIKDGVVELEREAFSLHFELPENTRVILHASFNPDLAERVEAGRPVDGQFAFQGRGMAEGVGNAERWLILTDDGYSYWPAPNANKHRFNEVNVREATGDRSTFHCVRNVERLFLHGAQETVSLEDFPYDEVYLVFVENEKDPTSHDTTRRAERLTIRFPSTAGSQEPPGVPDWRDREDYWYLSL
jgi:hypothetical protein